VTGTSPALVVPVKRFTDAKERLADVFDRDARAWLARRLAEGVLDAAGDLQVLVACDDDDVRSWAETRGHDVVWTPGRDLNGAVSDAVAASADLGVDVVGVAHADLPFPASLPSVVRLGGPDRVVVVADRHGDGTNVLIVPSTSGFRFSYGGGSFQRHVAEAARLGLELRQVVDDERLAWDVDLPADMFPPLRFGRPTWMRVR
jgi:2-phospho-L-lactate guanylyltransferase